MIEITSLHNQLVKDIVHLRERKERDQTGQFLIEGFREIKRALEGDVQLEVLAFCPELFLGVNEPSLIAQCKQRNVKIVQFSQKAFSKISYRDRPDGLIAIARQMKWGLDDLKMRFQKDPFLIVAEAIEKPGNLGTILRSSDAVALDGVIVCDRCTDIFNPNVVRASVGTLFTRPVIETSSEEAFCFLRDNAIKVVAATPHAEKAFTRTDLTGPIAIVVGTEQLGLSKKWLENADMQVRIPMLGSADSLNVATATTLLLYEVLRQRSLYGA